MQAAKTIAKRIALCLSAALLPILALGSLRAEDGPPKLDIEATCKSASSADVRVSDNSSVDGCLRSERAAHDELKKRWKDFTPAAKKQCAEQFQAGGFPSYVETVTCLELATGVVPTQPGEGGAKGGSAGGAAGKKEGSSLTAEPSASQRTNPIDVLNDQNK